MSRLLLLGAVLVLSLLCSVRADVSDAAAAEAQPTLLMEIGSESTINAQADRPLQEVAHLISEANRHLARLHASRQPFNVISNHIRVRRTAHVAAAPATVDATLVPTMVQPRIHDAQKFGTKHPITPGKHFVTAAIVGEDGKPYAPRKQYGVTDEPDTFRSPFAKYIHPPKVGSSADVVNKDPNTKLTPIELKSINSIQFRLKQILDKLGANFVWDHTNIKNRKLISDFEALKVESRTLMEEYELRTGVKTIAWQLQESDVRGLFVPNGMVKDIHFAEHPELATRVLQRPGDRRAPPALSDAELAILQKQHGIADAAAGINQPPPKPQEQRVDVAWKKGADGVVRAKVNLNVIDSKVKAPNAPANVAARSTVPATVYPSGKVGSISKAVNIDVVAPANEELFRNKEVGAPAAVPAAASLAEIAVDSAPTINL